jgi:hypothetical protein
MDSESVTVETELFDHRDVEPHFIDSNCFGEDVSVWLRGQVTDLAAALAGVRRRVREVLGTIAGTRVLD